MMPETTLVLKEFTAAQAAEKIDGSQFAEPKTFTAAQAAEKVHFALT